MERDEFFIGEQVVFEVDVLVNGVAPPNLTGTTPVLTIAPPPDVDGVARAEVTPGLTITGGHVHAAYTTLYEGWHEWRLATTGAITSARQGRFRVLPANV